jgi:hypothetical protein
MKHAENDPVQSNKQASSLFFAALVSFTLSWSAAGVWRERNQTLKLVAETEDMVARAVSSWPLATLGVIHLRYDSAKCGKESRPSQLNPERAICIVKDSNVISPRRIAWIDSLTYVTAVNRVMAENNVKSVYLSRDPSFPDLVFKHLTYAMGMIGSLKLEASAAWNHEGDNLKLIEWELSRQCRFFLADSDTPWSRSIIFARNNSETYAYASSLLHY